MDYTSFIKPDDMTSSIFDNIKNTIEDTLNEFKKFLLIQHVNVDLSGQLENIKESCEIDEISSDYANFGKDYDVVVFPLFYNFSDNVKASAGHCLTYDKRPIAGFLLINQNLSFDLKNSDFYLKNVLLHELSHVLVFNPIIFDSLGMMITKDSVNYITSSKALEKARQHFNCPSLTGIALENQGDSSSAGSHWESQYMLGDYMISTDYDEYVISDITMALFEDSGFYKVNYYSGGLFKFGKNKGCNFLNKKCIENGAVLSEEFCMISDQPMCSGSKTNKGYCEIYDYSIIDVSIPEEYQYFPDPDEGGFEAANFCPVSTTTSSSTDYFPDSCKVGTSSLVSDYGEKMGDNSFCFISSLLPTNSQHNSISQSICYEVQCDSTNKQIIVIVGSQRITCPTSGGERTISGFKGSITCPKYIDICNFKSNVMCKDIYDCLSKKVESDPDSYIYSQNDEDIIRVGRSSAMNIKINYFIFLLLLFMISN